MKLSYASVVKNIPDHLQQYVVDQNYSRYTPVDQATWRFSLRQLKHYLSENAYDCYSEGLQKTGISVEEIPRIDVMCEKLQDYGWFALPVSGFIPPAAFMEMQSLSILPIACDMRSIDHILYTPAPDIVHEAAGHAPILVDPEFANYLKNYAQAAKKAIISNEDLAQYEAIRELSDIKESPESSTEQIRAAENQLQKITASISHISEAALLARMNWWTAEYGLIGDLKRPKIFGAGLLSSVGEARSCLQADVEKIPLTVECIKKSYDITEKQPQLFVAPTFQDLDKVLDDLKKQMSYVVGGSIGLARAVQAKTINTVELNSGVQISGKLSEYFIDEKNKTYFVRFEGPCQLSAHNRELINHDKTHHPHGFSSPVGLLQNTSQCLSSMSVKDLAAIGVVIGQKCKLHFNSGIKVEGVLKSEDRSITHLRLLSFTECTVSLNKQILFQPDWGDFDMVIGSEVTSVFSGPADRKAYGIADAFVKKTVPTRKYSEIEKLKHSIYLDIRTQREKKTALPKEVISQWIESLKLNAPNEWLAFLEILELSCQTPDLADHSLACKKELLRIQKSYPEKSEYIELGLQLADKKII